MAQSQDQASTSKASPAPAVEYYVHYVGFDRRHDEWLPADMIKSVLPPAPPSASSQRRRPSSLHIMAQNLARAARPALSPVQLFQQQQRQGSTQGLLSVPMTPATPATAATGSPVRPLLYLIPFH